MSQQTGTGMNTPTTGTSRVCRARCSRRFSGSPGAFRGGPGSPRDRVARLEAAATPDPPTGGLLVKPDLELVRGLSLESRTRLYTQLAQASQNTDQGSGLKFYGTSADDWLAGSLIS